MYGNGGDDLLYAFYIGRSGVDGFFGGDGDDNMGISGSLTSGYNHIVFDGGLGTDWAYITTDHQLIGDIYRVADNNATEFQAQNVKDGTVVSVTIFDTVEYVTWDEQYYLTEDIANGRIRSADFDEVYVRAYESNADWKVKGLNTYDQYHGAVQSSSSETGPNVHRFFRPQSGTHFYTPSLEETNHVARQSLGELFSIENAIGEPPTESGWGYQYEGVAYTALPNNAPQVTNLYRFYNPNKGYHFMTANEDEALHVVNNSVGSNFDLLSAVGQQILDDGWGYQYEGRSYGVATESNDFANNKAYRFYHPQRGVHFFTASFDEALNVAIQSTGLNLGNDLDQALNASPNPSDWGYTYEGTAWYV